MENKFNVGDFVGTNIEYMHGFDDNHCPPRGLPRLKNLEVIKVNPCEKASKYSENYFYTLKSKSNKEYLINQCFLEAYNKEV